MAVFLRKLPKNNFRAIFYFNTSNIIGEQLFQKKKHLSKRWNLIKWLSNIFVSKKHRFNKSHISYNYSGHTPILLVTHPSSWSHILPSGHTPILLVTHPSYCIVLVTHPSYCSHTHPPAHTPILMFIDQSPSSYMWLSLAYPKDNAPIHQVALPSLSSHSHSTCPIPILLVTNPSARHKPILLATHPVFHLGFKRGMGPPVIRGT